MNEFIYPDNLGYIGFSIFVWNTDFKKPNKYNLCSPWGGVSGSEKLKSSKYVLEARFFVFGVLLNRILVNRNDFKDIEEISTDLLKGWSPIMDEIIKSYEYIVDHSGKHGIHIDEIVNDDIKKSIGKIISIEKRAQVL